MFPPGACFCVGFAFEIDGRGIGVPFPFTVGVIEGLFCRGVPLRAAVAPSSALAAPLIEKAGPKPTTSEEEDSGRGIEGIEGCAGLPVGWGTTPA